MTHRLGPTWGRSADFSVVTRAPDERFYAPLKWRKPALVFTCSMSDFFIEEADPWRAEAWRVIRETPHLTWQILTKRPERISAALPADWGEGYPNVWLGTSVETQQFADRRIPLLLKVPAAVRFLSVEPLLGPVSLVEYLGLRGPSDPHCPRCGSDFHSGLSDGLRPAELSCVPLVGGCGCSRHRRVHWVIVGGESGPKARPFDPAWARTIRDQCRDAGVAFFFKQGGASNCCPHSAKGGCFDCIPEDLRVREWPEGTQVPGVVA